MSLKFCPSLILSSTTACLLLAALACAAGCSGGGVTAATIVTAGAVAGVAADAVVTGSDVYRLGKLDAVEMAEKEKVISCIRLAVTDLGLTFKSEPVETPDGLQWIGAVQDDREETAHLVLERRTEKLTRIRIDVGWFGSETTARLLLTRIRFHLHPPTTQPVTTKPTTTQPATKP